ncbi:MAG: hypothetical protein IT162_06210 [Bryobacterales bacterium]|nr:hypothetical protein [Bryobacterales bacterium]
MTRAILLALGAMPFLCAAERPDFTGNWRQEGGQGGTITITQSEEELSISSKAGAGTEVKCALRGQSCKAIVDGERVSVSYWFNGPMLVEMATGGKQKDRAVKTRRKLAEDGQTMEVEVMPIAPPGKAEKLTFVKTHP